MALIVASANGATGLPAGIEILRAGGSVLDAVEAATRVVEADPSDHTVGYGGYPNVLGEVELDASIMDGTARRGGAVCALKGYRHPVTVARAVMERTAHVLLAGEGAARLAAEIGMQPEDLLTDEARDTWRQGLEGKAPKGSLAEMMLSRFAALATDPDHVAGTVNFIARDDDGKLASAVSTSGWAWKHPGRVGDSPVIGAGNYCDDRHGAATCTGWGELAILVGTSRSVVDALARGVSLADALRAAMLDLEGRGVPSKDIVMRTIAVARDGGHGGAATRDGLAYVFQTTGMDEPASAPLVHVALT